MDDSGKVAGIELSMEDSWLELRFSGDWSIHGILPEIAEIIPSIELSESILGIRPLLNDAIEFDSSLASFIFQVSREANSRGLKLDYSPLPSNLLKLIELGQQVVQAGDSVSSEVKSKNWIEEFGEISVRYIEGTLEIATFTGDWVIALSRLLRGKAKIRWDDFWQIMKSVSVDALPIVALISFLIGVIIAFLGAVTLKQFGAEFAVAYLVGFGILREMGAIMTGIIMAGRSGAAFAAQIGSMKINEEIDALKTLGISPIEFIVLPRLLALVIMMPLLTLFSNVIGILSGWLVAEGLMGVPGPVFFVEMQSVLYIGDFLLGLFKACVFGVLVATAGCLRGLQSGTGADAVGVAATRAVVAGITLIVFSNALIDWAAATIGI